MGEWGGLRVRERAQRDPKRNIETRHSDWAVRNAISGHGVHTRGHRSLGQRRNRWVKGEGEAGAYATGQRLILSFFGGPSRLGTELVRRWPSVPPVHLLLGLMRTITLPWSRDPMIVLI